MKDFEDFAHALSRAAKQYPGGISGLASELGMSASNLYSKLDPNDELHQPSLPLLITILHKLDRSHTGEVLDALSGMFGFQLATRCRQQAATVSSGAIHAMSEFGDVVRAVESAIDDGHINDHERRTILRESAEARQALIALENTLLNTEEQS